MKYSQITKMREKNKSNLYKRSYTNRVRHEMMKKEFFFCRWILIARVMSNRAIHHRFNPMPTYRLAWRNRQEKNKRIHRSELSNSRDGFVVEVHFRYARRERGTNARLY